MEARNSWWAICCEGKRLMERSGTGQLAIYYSREDAEAAFEGVKRGADEGMRAGLRICEVSIFKVRELPLGKRPCEHKKGFYQYEGDKGKEEREP